MIAAYIVDAIRTPIGSFAGTLSAVRADDLAAHVLRELMSSSPTLDPTAIDDVILGCANQAGEDNRNVARMSLLLAGLPVTVPAETVNRLCASGMGAAVSAGRAITAGHGDVLIAGGVENMTRGPWVMSKTMRLSGPESLASAANIFIGQTEEPLFIKPYLPHMTRSEILCLMCGGMATIAGGVFAAYVGFLGGSDPEQQLYFAKQLLAASLMSAPEP